MSGVGKRYVTLRIALLKYIRSIIIIKELFFYAYCIDFFFLPYIR